MGAYLEREGNPEDVKREAWRLVAKGVAAEFLFAAALWQIDSTSTLRQKAEILAVEKRLAPRTLDEDQKALIKSAVVTPFKVSFAFSAATDEDLSLANALAEPLSAAGWTRVGWPFAGAVSLPFSPAIGHITLVNGVQLHPLNPKLDPLVSALIKVLEPMGVGYVRPSEAALLPQNPNNPMIMVIIIGPRR